MIEVVKVLLFVRSPSNGHNAKQVLVPFRIASRENILKYRQMPYTFGFPIICQVKCFGSNSALEFCLAQQATIMKETSFEGVNATIFSSLPRRETIILPNVILQYFSRQQRLQDLYLSPSVLLLRAASIVPHNKPVKNV